MRKYALYPIMSFLRKPKFIRSRLKRIELALFGLVQSLADTQLVTGLAMLVAAVIKLHEGRISVCHFTVVTNLAWFSSGAHLLALLAIRTEVLGSMKEGQRFQYKDYSDQGWMKQFAKRASRRLDIWVRLVSMMGMAALLLYCSWVAGADGLYDWYECPAKCALDKPKGGEPLSWMIVSFVFVIRGYWEWVFLLWWTFQKKWLGSRFRVWLVDGQGVGRDDWKNLPLWKRIWVWVWYVEKSETLNFLTDGPGWFIFGVYSAFHDRQVAQDYFSDEKLWASEEERDKENDVEGFGQLMPLLLIGLPFLQVLQAYCGKSDLSILPRKDKALTHWTAQSRVLQLQAKVEGEYVVFIPEEELAA